MAYSVSSEKADRDATLLLAVLGPILCNDGDLIWQPARITRIVLIVFCTIQKMQCH